MLSEEKFNKLKEINKKYGYGSWTLWPKNESRKSDPKNKDVSDISFIKDMLELEIITLRDLKHVNCLPDLSKHKNLQRIFLIDTGIDVKKLPKYLQEKVSNWDNR